MKVSILESVIKISSKKLSTKSWKLDVVLQIFDLQDKRIWEKEILIVYRDIIVWSSGIREKQKHI